MRLVAMLPPDGVIGSRLRRVLNDGWEQQRRRRRFAIKDASVLLSPAFWSTPLSLQRVRRAERLIVVGSRFLTIPAVVGSLFGSILMFFQGVHNIYEAYASIWRVSEANAAVEQGAASVISVIESLDRFLIAIVLLYFSYGVYSLFIHPEEQETDLALPAWLRVVQIGQLKQVVAEVIIVVLLVLFLRVALEAFSAPRVAMSWEQIATFVLLPICTVLLALSLRLVQLHPKPQEHEEIAKTIANGREANRSAEKTSSAPSASD
jgi:uncharacterized membrane protein YqhA